MAIINSTQFQKVYSYHVYVGHGNASFVVMQDNNKQTMIIAVDASESENAYNRKFASYLSNIDECIQHILNEFELDKFEVDIFLLTHPHWDHYSGIMYLIINQYITKNTQVWLNKFYRTPSGFYMSILVELTKLKCKFIEPIVSTASKCPFLKIWYPDISPISSKSKYRRNGKLANNPIINKPNNASVLIQVLAENTSNEGRVSLLFTGDIETEGWNKVKCPKYLGGIQYYCISHHGSMNGHKRTVCHYGCKIDAITDCPNQISTAILMGRDGAHKINHNLIMKEFMKPISTCICVVNKPKIVLRTESGGSGQSNVKFLEIDLFANSHKHY